MSDRTPTFAVESAATDLQTLADDLPPDWPDRFETIIDNLRDAFVALADAELLTDEARRWLS